MLALQLGLAVAPLIGWGLGDLEGFASNPARLAVVAVAITSCSLVARQQTLGDPFAKGVHAPSAHNQRCWFSALCRCLSCSAGSRTPTDGTYGSPTTVSSSGRSAY